MTIYRAKWIVPGHSPPIENGCLAFADDGTFRGFGAWEEFASETAEIRDLGESVIMPALANAHAHLDYSGLRGKIPPTDNFVAWLKEMIRCKRTLGDLEVLDAIADGIKESHAAGTGFTWSVVAFPHLARSWDYTDFITPKGLSNQTVNILLNYMPVAWLGELIDIGRKDDVPVDGISFNWLAPHAPYTVSPELYAAIGDLGFPCMTHLAETEEEYEMIAERRGALHDLMAPLGECRHKRTSPFRAIYDLLPEGSSLVHMNVLDEKDWELLAPNEKKFTVVHCPGTHKYFSRPKFPLERFHKLEIPVALGTDSLASNDSLSMFDAMRDLLDAQPEVSPHEALQMATLGPWGTGAYNTWPRFLTIPSTAADPYESIMRFDGELYHLQTRMAL